jgi:hypothetical protein
LTLVACPECEAINGLDAAHCHQCGASLGTDEQEVDAPIPASEATSVPTPQSGPLLDGTSGDRTPIALAERFERRPASSRRTPPLGRVDERAAVSVSAGPAHPEQEPRLDEHAIVEEPVDLRGRPQPALPVRAAPQRRVPLAILALVVIGIAAGAYYGWLDTTHPDVAAPATSSEQNASTDNAAPQVTPAAPSSSLPANRTEPPTVATPQEPASSSSEPERSAPAASPEPAASSPSGEPPSSTPAGAQSPGSPPANARTTTSSSRPLAERQATRARPATRAPTVDKDALATQRLIERDLGKFLPRTYTNGSAQ